MNYLVNTSFNSSVLSLRLAAFLDCPNLRAIKLCFHKMDGWNLNFMLDNVKEKNLCLVMGKYCRKMDTSVFGRSYILQKEKEIYFDPSLSVWSDINRILVTTFSMKTARNIKL